MRLHAAPKPIPKNRKPQFINQLWAKYTVAMASVHDIPELSRAEVRRWGCSDILEHFEHLLVDKPNLYAEHAALYRTFLEGKDGIWMLGIDATALKELAAEMPIFQNRLHCSTFLKIVTNARAEEPRNKKGVYAAVAEDDDEEVPASIIYTEERADAMVAAMYDAGVRLLCFDFDLTIVSYHTKGRWYGSAEELYEYARPVCREIIRAAIRSKTMRLACTTFSGQVRAAL